MAQTVVTIDARAITDWDSLHNVFAKAFEFPDYYGRNMDAWIDCMTDFVLNEETVVITLENAKDFKKRCPNIWDALIECSAFVNHRHMSNQQLPAVLALSFHT